jgi:hypothetical protein
MLVSLMVAAVIAAPPTSPVTSECEQSVSKLVGAAGADTRVVITFTRPQNALLPSDERAGPNIESTLFPVAKDRFVLTLQVRPAQPNPSAAAAFANRLCSLGLSSGGRFNGVMSFKRESMTNEGLTLTRERMTNAMMADVPKN